MPRAPVTDIQGYDPLVDPRRRQQPVVVRGRNFIMDADGPVSGFGRTNLTDCAFADGRGMQSFDISLLEKSVYCTVEGIFERADTHNEIAPLYVFDTALTDYYPWSTAEVGGKQYFVRRGISLIEYDPTTDRWAEVSAASLPANIYSITQSGGRLIVLAVGLVAWSAIDDANDFVPSLSTGAGFQSLSKINATKTEDPYMVFEFENGFITYTKQGLMVSELVDANNPFRHDALSRKHAPLSPYAITPFGDFQHVFMSRQGLFSTNGGVPEIFLPLLSEYFHDVEIPRLDTSYPTVLRLYYNDARQWFVISVADQPASILYNRAFHVYIPTQKTGLFNRAHRAFVDINVIAGDNIGLRIGYVDTHGTLWQFNDGTADLIRPIDTTTNRIVDYRTNPPIAAQETAADTIFTTWIRSTDDEQEGMDTVGYYDQWTVTEEPSSPLDPESLTSREEASEVFTTDSQIDSVFGVVETRVRAYDQAGLNAYIGIGLLRAATEEFINHLSYLTGVGIGALEGSPGDTFEDFLLDYIDTDVFEDWNTIPDGTADEDWGEGTRSQSDFVVKVYGTLDGHNTWEEQEETAQKVLQSGSFTDWSMYVTGLFHIVEIIADDAGESFHIKSMEIDVKQGGVLP